MTDANQWYFPDQLVVSVDGNIRRDGDNEEIAASSAIQVDVEEEDYQDKINEFLNRIQSPEEREQYRQLLIGYSLLPHGRTETMERSYLMERFVKFLAESLRDTAQLRGPSDAMLTYVRGIIQEPEATMESVLEVLAEWWEKMVAHETLGWCVMCWVYFLIFSFSLATLVQLGFARSSQGS